jgi:hypothetical protein
MRFKAVSVSTDGRDLLYNPRGVSNDYHSIWNVLGNDRACAYSHSIPNFDSWQDNSCTSYPAIVADGYWLCPFSAFRSIALFWGGGMDWSVDLDVGTEHGAIADGYWVVNKGDG